MSHAIGKFKWVYKGAKQNDDDHDDDDLLKNYVERSTEKPSF